MLSTAAILAMALACAPRISPDVSLPVAYAESRWDPLAIHDNRTGQTLDPPDAASALRIANRLIAKGHRPDLGLMQINARNLGRLGLSVQQAFDPCRSLHAGGEILLGDYAGGRTPTQQQSAILRALSAYNTGSPSAGLNTYTPLVLAAARKVIPTLRLTGVASLAPSGSPVTRAPYATQLPHTPPAATPKNWNVFPGSLGPGRLAQQLARRASIANHRARPAGPSRIATSPTATTRKHASQAVIATEGSDD